MYFIFLPFFNQFNLSRLDLVWSEREYHFHSAAKWVSPIERMKARNVTGVNRFINDDQQIIEVFPHVRLRFSSSRSTGIDPRTAKYVHKYTLTFCNKGKD